MRNLIVLTAVLALTLAGCGKKEEPAATGSNAADTSLAKQNSATPTGGASDTSRTISQAERGATTLPAGTPENAPAAREHGNTAKRHHEHRSGGEPSEDRGGEHADNPSKAAESHVRYATVPAGKVSGLTLSTALSSETAKIGDEFTAQLAEDWVVDNQTVAPAGTKVIGHVSAVESAGRGKAKASLGLAYERLELPDGQTVDISAQPQSFEAEGTTKRDIALTGAGALIGGLLGHASGDTKKGAVIGGVVGGAAALGARGKPMELEAGHKLNLVLQSDAKVPVRKSHS